MTTRRVLFRKVLVDIFFFAVWQGILYTILYLFLDKRDLLTYSLLLAGPFLVMTFLRLRLKNFFLFFLGHFLCVLFPLLLPIPFVEKTIAVAFLLIACINSSVRRLRETKELQPFSVYFCLFINMVIMLILWNLDLTYIYPHLTGWVFVVILCALLHRQTEQVDHSLDILSQTNHQPVGKILRFNNRVIIIFLLLVALASVISQVVPVGRIFTLLATGLLAAVRWFFSLFPAGESSPVEFLPEEPMTEQQPMEIFTDEIREPSAFLEILEKILIYVVGGALILGVLLLLGYGIYRLYKKFADSHTLDSDSKEFVPPDLSTEALKGFFRRFRLPDFGRGEAARIRRSYYKKVRRHIKQGIEIRPQDTPWDIDEQIRPKEDISEITAQYERVRYGPRHKSQ